MLEWSRHASSIPKGNARMLEFRSPLAACCLPGRYGAGTGDAPLTLGEMPLGALFQISGWPQNFAIKAGDVLGALGFTGIGDHATAQRAPGAIAFRVAPERILVRLFRPSVGAAAIAAADPIETPILDLGHSRAVMRISGPANKELLARLLPIDLDEGVFVPDRFAQTGFHGVSILLHRVDDTPEGPVYDLYVPYTWARTVWEMVRECAAPFGYRVVMTPAGSEAI